MNPRGLWDLEPHGNLYKHPHAKRKGVYGFQGDLNPVGPEGSSYTIANQIISLLGNKTACVSLLSIKSA